jgi:hypothetical protein
LRRLLGEKGIAEGDSQAPEHGRVRLGEERLERTIPVAHVLI